MFVTIGTRFETDRIVTLVVIVSVAIIIAIIVIFSEIINVDAASDIIAQRLTYRSVSGPISYLLNLQMVVLSPFLLYMGIRRKRPVPVVIATVATAIIFFITAHKLSLAIFAVVLVLSVWRQLARLIGRKLFIAATALVLLIGAHAIDRNVFERPVVGPFAAYRTLMVHGVINILAVEYFSEAPKALWSASFMRHFIEPVYEEDPFMLLGRVYFREGTRANTNFFGDGFINLGIPGVFIMTVLTGLMLLFSTLVFNRHGPSMLVLFLPVCMALLNTPLQVTLLTNGLILLWIILLVLPPEDRVSDRAAPIARPVPLT